MIAGATTDSVTTERVTETERQARNGHRPAVITVADRETLLFVERRLFDLGLQVIGIDAITPGSSRKPTVLSAGHQALYRAGYVIIHDSAFDLTDWPMQVLEIPWDSSQDPDIQLRTIQQLVNVR